MLVPTELFWAYLVAISLLTVTPGVDTLLVMRNAGRGGLKHGLRDGCVTSVGICCGLFIHATLSALGISVLLVETAWAFTAVKWAGACYLIWLGLSSLRQAMARGPANADESSISSAEPPLMKPVSIWVAFREGLLSNVLNPKTALFYIAVPCGGSLCAGDGLAMWAGVGGGQIKKAWRGAGRKAHAERADWWLLRRYRGKTGDAVKW
jgi:threonine/homoserine/homoserine lactone efflux protein